MSRGPYVDKLEGLFSAHHSEEGARDWFLPVLSPLDEEQPEIGRQETRGLKCTDLAKLDNENDRERVCASSFWTSAIGPDGSLAAIQQPSNAPLAAAVARNRNFGFALGRYVCPFQCGDLRYEQEFSNVPVQIDPTSGRVAIIVNNSWAWYDNLDQLRKSKEYRNLLSSYPGNMKKGLWKELQQLRNVRKDFASLDKTARRKSDQEIYNSASVLNLGQSESFIASNAETATKQDVECVRNGSELPYRWADNERIPSDFNTPTLEMNALNHPESCKVTTTEKTNEGTTTLSSIVAKKDIQSTLQGQLAAIEASNIAELGALISDSLNKHDDNTNRKIEVERRNIAAFGDQVAQLTKNTSDISNRLQAIDSANIAAISSLA